MKIVNERLIATTNLPYCKPKSAKYLFENITHYFPK